MRFTVEIKGKSLDHLYNAMEKLTNRVYGNAEWFVIFRRRIRLLEEQVKRIEKKAGLTSE